VTAHRLSSDDAHRAAAHELADLDGLLARLAASPALRGHDVRRLAVEEPPPIDLAPALADALAHPVGSPALRELALGRRSAVIIITDPTRAVPSRALLGPVMHELGRGGIAPQDVEVVIGAGAHRAARPDEIVEMLGEWAARLRVSNHDARAADLVQVGYTPRGTPLLLNRRVAAADLRIAFGQVEPHEFAGFTGGRKAILPSVAGYETIVRNHSVEMLGHPLARPGVIDDNPIHQEMLAAARLAGLHFIVNVALDSELRPLAVAAGDAQAAHEQLVAFVRRFSDLPVPADPPAVIVTGPGRPLDINLYQTIKALVGIEPLLDAHRSGPSGARGDRREPPAAASPAAGRAPVIVLLARCWDGSGADELFEPFARARARFAGNKWGDGGPPAHDVARAALTDLVGDFAIEKDESYYVARITPKCRCVVACCPGVRDERLRAFGWEAAADPDEALTRALQLASAPATDEPGGARRPLVLFCPRPQRALFMAGAPSP